MPLRCPLSASPPLGVTATCRSRVDKSGHQLRLTFTPQKFPLVRAKLKLPDGKTLSANAALDTGAGATVYVGGPFHRRHRLASTLGATAVVPLGVGAGGLVSGQWVRAPAFMLGELEFLAPILSLPDAVSGGAVGRDGYDFNVAGDILKRFTVTFDYGRAIVRFVPNSRINEPCDVGMTGLWLTTAGAPYDRFFVERLTPGSPAESAGLQAGDQILAVNGDPVRGLKLEAVRKRFGSPEGTAFAITVDRAGRTLVFRFVTRRQV